MEAYELKMKKNVRMQVRKTPLWASQRIISFLLLKSNSIRLGVHFSCIVMGIKHDLIFPRPRVGVRLHISLLAPSLPRNCNAFLPPKYSEWAPEDKKISGTLGFAKIEGVTSFFLMSRPIDCIFNIFQAFSCFLLGIKHDKISPRPRVGVRLHISLLAPSLLRI